MNPGPHGPELCDISFRNDGNDRFSFEFVRERLARPAIERYLFAGSLHELLQKNCLPANDHPLFSGVAVVSAIARFTCAAMIASPRGVGTSLEQLCDTLVGNPQHPTGVPHGQVGSFN